MLLHPWFYPYLTVMGLLTVALLLLIPRAWFGLRRDIAEHRAYRDARRAEVQAAERATEVHLRDLFQPRADLGPVEGERRWQR